MTLVVADVGWSAEPLILKGHEGHVRALAFSPDGKLLASGSDDRSVRLWNIPTGQTKHALTGHQAWIGALAFSPETICTATFQGDECKLWDLASGKCLRDLDVAQTWAHSVAFAPDGKLLATGTSHFGRVRLWNPESGELLRIFEGYTDIEHHTTAVHALAFAPAGQLLAAADSSGVIQLWEPKAGKLIQRIKAYPTPKVIRRLELSPDASHVAAAAFYDEAVRVWDTKSGQEKRVFDTGRVRGLAFSRNSKLLVTVSGSDTLALWDLASGEKLHVQSLRPGYDAVVSPDREWLATAGPSSEIYLWKTTELLPAQFNFSRE